MRIGNKSAALASAVALAACVASLTAAPAGAAVAAGPCGSGYKLVGTYDISKGGKQGTLEVRWNAGTGKNCALAYGTGANYGRTAYKGVRIKVHGTSGWAGSDAGQYKYYAGPVYVTARGKCISVAGDIKGSQGIAFAFQQRVHCG
ncbi:spore-associated protein A [Nonomuraea sp. MG754425]|uniref:hypothetical protein n=1 Tax=Nonomuraea sp. MG754425 TaxID=2570319 RepID=UPI001F186E7A|nr:hypothetical protein [Nonomuraea sp. MG754425]MCF6470383.1 spore-associated protein A [Nonomuraea sp. MG754425]